MSTGSKEPTATVFEPRDSFQCLTRHSDHIPHYLIRTSSPRSSGVTTNALVASSAVEHKTSRVDIFSRDRQDAINMLESHLLWEARTNDNLVSWTSSFLFATQHAIRRERTDWPPSAPGSIYVSIVDTRKLPRGSFFPAVALLEAYNIKSKGKLKHDYYHGEYLSQGRMDVAGGAIVTTTLEALIDHGLYELYPPFADEAKKSLLYRRVLELRQSFKSTPEVPTPDEIRFAQAISVGCFLRIGIRPIVMMILLSLKPRYRLDFTILEAFRESCLGEYVSAA